MNYAKISQAAHYAPRQVVSNDDLAEIMVPVMSGFQVELGLKTAIYRQMKPPVI